MIKSRKHRERRAARRAYFERHGELPPSRQQQAKIDDELDKRKLTENPHLRTMQ